MRELEELYTILTATDDLLRHGFIGDHEPLHQRVQHLMAELDGSDHAGHSFSSVTQETASVSDTGPGAATIPFVEQQDMEEHRRYTAMSRDEREARLHGLYNSVIHCERCPLSLGRTHAVPGEGVLDPLVLFVGEAPGDEENRSGRPFVGQSGEYLEKWISAIGLDRSTQVYIANIVKCQPPNSRDPRPLEIDTCSPYVYEQIQLVRPRIIMTLGRVSMRMLTGTTRSITRIHGTFFSWHGIPVVPTFHPSEVLRNPEWRRPVWEDLKVVRNWLADNAGLALPRD